MEKVNLSDLRVRGLDPKKKSEIALKRIEEWCFKTFSPTYDFSKAFYKTNGAKMILICPQHGEFERSLCNLEEGLGCPVCNEEKYKQKRLQNILEKAKKVHNNKYDYSLVEKNFKNLQYKVPIVCPEHGVFEKSLELHVRRGFGCPLCRGFNPKRRKPQTQEAVEEGIKKVLKRNPNIQFLQTTYFKDRNEGEAELFCIKHNLKFTETFYRLRVSEHFCPQCLAEQRAFQRGNKTLKDYERTITQKLSNPLCQIFSLDLDHSRESKLATLECSKHGKYQKKIYGTKDFNCPQCSLEHSSTLSVRTTEEFVEEMKKIHGDEFDYSLVEYKGYSEKIKIICKIHGVFEQTAEIHSKGGGCPFCHSSKLERFTREVLKKKKIEFEEQKAFESCKNERALRFDFYLPKFRVCVECQGIQHYKKVKHFGGEVFFQELQKRDQIKRDWCKNNNIHLLEISYANRKLEQVERKLKKFLKKVAVF